MIFCNLVHSEYDFQDNFVFYSSCRPLDSYSSSGSSSWWGKKKRKKRHNYHLHHAGVVVTIRGSVLGQNRWLIHKGSDYGDSWDTVITDADYMSSR